MKIRVLFYKAAIDGHFLDNAISFWSGLFNWGTKGYSHCEIWWPTGDGFFDGIGTLTGKQYFYGECFTSTMRDEIDGTVIRPAYEVLRNPKRWDVCEMWVDEPHYATAIPYARTQAENNKGYDKLCIASFFFPVRFHNKSKNICSEIVQKFLVVAGILTKPKIWSPRRLSRKLIKKGYKIGPLIKIGE